MDIKRIARHFFITKKQLKNTFPPRVLKTITEAIKSSETLHDGEIRFAIEPALDGVSLLNRKTSRERAVEIFSQLHVWDTEHNNGLLIYLLLADRAVEIVADRGIHAKVGSEQWKDICKIIEADFKVSAFETGMLTGIQSVTELLIKYFPASGPRVNELNDKPVMLMTGSEKK